jgi:hypothetical protein
MPLLGKGKIILSCLKMEANGADINNRPCSLPGGKQGSFIEGYQMTLEFKNRLAYLCCCKPTDNETGLLPDVIMTSNIDWDPKLYDNDIDSFEDFHDPTLDVNDHFIPFHTYGEYRHRTVATHHLIEEEANFDTIEYNDFEDLVDDILDTVNPTPVKDTSVVTLTIDDQQPNFDLLRPLFGWAPADTIK